MSDVSPLAIAEYLKIFNSDSTTQDFQSTEARSVNSSDNILVPFPKAPYETREAQSPSLTPRCSIEKSEISQESMKNIIP